jgi:hypothetical protein
MKMGIKSWFKKKEEVVDLSDLQRRGIYNPKEEKTTAETVDLTSSNTNTSEDASPLGFLGNLAGSETSSSAESPERKQRLKTVISDIRSEVKQNGDKVYKLSDRLDLIERKLDRIERRVGL